MAFIFNNIGQAYEAMGNRVKAIDFIAKSRAVAEKNKMRPRVATSLAVLAKINLDEGHFDEAQNLYEQSLAISHELRDALSEGRALLGLAEVARRGRKFEQGLTRAHEAIDLFEKTGQFDWLVTALVSAGRSQRALKNSSEARKSFEQAISTVETLRTQVAGTELEAEAFFEARVAPYEEMISLLVAENHPLEALQVADRASARVLLDVMLRRGPEVTRSMLSEPEAAHERGLDRHIGDLNRELNREYSAEHRDGNTAGSVGRGIEGSSNRARGLRGGDDDRASEAKTKRIYTIVAVARGFGAINPRQGDRAFEVRRDRGSLLLVRAATGGLRKRCNWSWRRSTFPAQNLRSRPRHSAMPSPNAASVGKNQGVNSTISCYARRKNSGAEPIN